MRGGANFPFAVDGAVCKLACPCIPAIPVGSALAHGHVVVVVASIRHYTLYYVKGVCVHHLPLPKSDKVHSGSTMSSSEDKPESLFIILG